MLESNTKDFSSQLVYSKLVSSGKAGGRKFLFSSFSISGNKKNKIGMGYGRANQPGSAIKKSIFSSIKNAEYFSFGDSDTIPFEAKSKYKSSIVFLKPCSKNNGLKAGGVVRKILTLLGIKNVTSKIIGSKHPKNVALATFEALRFLEERKKILHNREILYNIKKDIKEDKDNNSLSNN